jgi:arylsulfatase A
MGKQPTKKILFKVWKDIETEGPSEWWQGERNKPMRGGTLND